MKSLNFLNQNLLLLPKGGSTLWEWVITLYCGMKGLELKTEMGEGETTLIVRNPYDRFLSGFLHHHLITSPTKWECDEDIIESLGEWMDKCWEGEGEENTHLMRASSLTESIPIDKVWKVEEIEKEIIEWGDWKRGAVQPKGVDRVITEPPPYWGEILPFEGWDGHHFWGLYLQSKRNVAGHHRVELRERVSYLLQNHRELKESVECWVKDDMWKWGYQKLI